MTEAHSVDIEALAGVFSDCQPDESEHGLARAVLASDWLRNLIAQAKAEVLRDAADLLPTMTEGADRSGTELWPDRDRNTYSLAIEEAQSALRDRADRLSAPAMCHNGHEFKPGVSVDHAPDEADPRWCDTCGERRISPERQDGRA